MPALQQCNTQILVDALHDPHAVVISDAREGDLHAGHPEHDAGKCPLEIMALSSGQMLNGVLGQFGKTQESRQSRRDGFVLKKALIQKIGDDDAESQGEKPLRNTDGGVIDKVGPCANAYLMPAAVSPVLNRPSEKAGSTQGSDIYAACRALHDVCGDDNGAGSGQYDAEGGVYQTPAS